MREIHATAENRIAEFDINGETYTVHRDGDNLINVPHGDVTTAYTETMTRRADLDGTPDVEPLADGYGVHPDFGASDAFGGGVVWLNDEAFGLEWDDDAYVCVAPDVVS